jgi:parafibromin
MASADAPQHDALLLLRQSIASDTPAVPTLTSSPPTSPTPDLPLSSAQYLHFPSASTSIALTAPTRFSSSSTPVDLRSIYFAWLKREVAIPDYNAAALALNNALSADGAAGGAVQNLAFVERLDLITWLEGASEDSEYIKPLAADSARAAASAQVASGAAGGAAPAASAAGARNRTIDPRLQEIYNGERRMGDRNSVLRGVKPTVRLTSPSSFPLAQFSPSCG